MLLYFITHPNPFFSESTVLINIYSSSCPFNIFSFVSLIHSFPRSLWKDEKTAYKVQEKKENQTFTFWRVKPQKCHLKDSGVWDVMKTYLSESVITNTAAPLGQLGEKKAVGLVRRVALPHQSLLLHMALTDFLRSSNVKCAWNFLGFYLLQKVHCVANTFIFKINW